MIGYILFGVFAVIFIYMMCLYLINSKKIKNKANKTAEKSKDKDEKVEVKSEISDKTPLEKAISEVNDFSKGTEIEQAYKQMEAQREAFEKAHTHIQKHGGLIKNRDNFKTELQIAMETNQMAMQENKISSETNVIGREGPSQAQIDRTNREIELENQQTQGEANSIAEQINNMSPEAKAILINDILGKKY